MLGFVSLWGSVFPLLLYMCLGYASPRRLHRLSILKHSKASGEELRSWGFLGGSCLVKFLGSKPAQSTMAHWIYAPTNYHPDCFIYMIECVFEIKSACVGVMHCCGCMCGHELFSQSLSRSDCVFVQDPYSDSTRKKHHSGRAVWYSLKEQEDQQGPCNLKNERGFGAGRRPPALQKMREEEWCERWLLFLLLLLLLFLFCCCCSSCSCCWFSSCCYLFFFLSLVPFFSAVVDVMLMLTWYCGYVVVLLLLLLLLLILLLLWWYVCCCDLVRGCCCGCDCCSSFAVFIAMLLLFVVDFCLWIVVDGDLVVALLFLILFFIVVAVSAVVLKPLVLNCLRVNN